MSKKQPFLLLELLIAFTLLSGSLFYWIKSSSKIAKESFAISMQNELARICDERFYWLHNELRSGKFKWDDLDHYKKNEVATIFVEPLGVRKYPYEISFTSQEVEAKDGLYKKVKVTFLFDNSLSKENKFLYSFLAKRGN